MLPFCVLPLRAWSRGLGYSLRYSSTSDLPVIHLPRRAQQFLERREKKHAGEVQAPRAGRLLISSRRRELNQYSRETCGQWEKPPLVSQGWKHRKSRGDYFTINRQREQRPWPETEETFHSLSLDPSLVSSLDVLNITSPTWIQKQAIPALLQGKNVLCASETGSGKTLAYLVPIIHRLITHECDSSSDPRSLILVPSRELGGQVTSVARRLCAQLGLSVRFVGGGHGRKAIANQFRDEPLDVLVATPGALLKALKWGKVSLSDLHYVVVDEADTLFDDTFCELIEGILSHTQIASRPSDLQRLDRKAQLAVIGATFPRGVAKILKKVTDLGSIETIKSKRLHFLMPHVQQVFKKIKGLDKIHELVETLKKQVAEKPGTGVLVFCNSSSTVNWLGYLLDDHGIKHVRLHGRMPADMRSGIFETFQKGQHDVLVCTDIASRGLDSLRVDTVVNYDFPPTLEDYLHRAGRVGRVGSECKGVVVSFVTHAWDVELVQKIETAARKRSSLPGLESSIKDPVKSSDIIKEEQQTL
ncbi:probable ATP-dependent RNA helicase DDX28 [Hyla sarda]|uniref:probable ATP-dependent RNA helicase DDX28 n=1 Tax=Hyla sarda TaxID=327740 RepID=UPI0024C3566B|nr:probable ATP-dependent RNA helicase DDX28 [Hyla sarda]